MAEQFYRAARLQPGSSCRSWPPQAGPTARPRRTLPTGSSPITSSFTSSTATEPGSPSGPGRRRQPSRRAPWRTTPEPSTAPPRRAFGTLRSSTGSTAIGSLTPTSTKRTAQYGRAGSCWRSDLSSPLSEGVRPAARSGFCLMWGRHSGHLPSGSGLRASWREVTAADAAPGPTSRPRRR